MTTVEHLPPCATHWKDYDPNCESCLSIMWSLRERPVSVTVYGLDKQPATVAVYRYAGPRTFERVLVDEAGTYEVRG